MQLKLLIQNTRHHTFLTWQRDCQVCVISKVALKSYKSCVCLVVIFIDIYLFKVRANQYQKAVREWILKEYYEYQYMVPGQTIISPICSTRCRQVKCYCFNPNDNIFHFLSQIQAHLKKCGKLMLTCCRVLKSLNGYRLQASVWMQQNQLSKSCVLKKAALSF